MTISYPLSLPSTPGFLQITLHAVNNIGVLRCPYTFLQQVQEYDGQAWAAEIELPPMERADAEYWAAFLLALGGQKGTFLLGDPLGKTPRGTGAGTPVVNGAGQTGQSLATRGWTALSAILKAGDYLQIGQRLYKVLADVSAAANGQATIDIWPRLRSSPADGEAITLTNTKGLFRLAENVVPIFSTPESRLYDVSFNAVEAL